MILIITNEADYSTSIVINWLHFFNLDFIRINENDEVDVSFDKNEIIFKNKQFKFLLSDLKGVWYRRGFLKIVIDKINDEKLDNFRKLEISKVKEFIYYKLSLLQNINQYENSDVNKLVVSSIAREFGLLVPEDILVNSRLDLLKHQSSYNLATKSISGSSMFFYKDFYFVGYTSLVKEI